MKPSPHGFLTWAQAVRYEDGAWPLWRVDQGLRYGLKSLFHKHRAPGETRQHFARMRAYQQQHQAAFAKPDGRVERPGDRRLTLAAVGDLMWIAAGWPRVMSSGVQSSLRAAELRVANLETPVDPERAVPRLTYARFNAPFTLLDKWNALGATVLSLCNNHALDQGIDGLRRTRGNVEARANLHPIGGVEATDATAVVELHGLRIGFVATTFGINPWGHAMGMDGGPPGVPVVRFGSAVHVPDFDRMRRLLDQLRAKAPDLVVVMPHWGFEFECWPEQRQREDAYRLIELGADVVVGSSPHVLQPVDIVSVNRWDARCPVQLTRPGPSRAGVIAYSLGNFLSSMTTLGCCTGCVLKLPLCVRADGQLDLERVSATVTASLRSGLRRATSTRLAAELEASRRERHLAHARGLLGSLVDQ